MNKLEQYKKDQAHLTYPMTETSLFSNLQRDGFNSGFDTAIALELPVKFAQWQIDEKITWYAPEGSIPSYFKEDNHSMYISSVEELYQYWLENIYKFK